MIVNVDWLSFTFPFALSKDEDGVIDPAVSFEEAMSKAWGSHISFIDAFEDWTAGGGRAPYTNSMYSKQAGIHLWTSPILDHVLCEITGHGCHVLRSSGILNSMIERHQKRVTRIDIACDIETSVKPPEFAAVRTTKRFKSGGHQFSDTGETIYVGSKSSDRYARVYRYYDPHPRAHLLRVEMVFRAEQAREISRRVLTETLYELAASCGAIYGWQHETWNTGISNPTPVSSYSEERHQGSTVRWLFTQVLPAAKRVCDEGETEHVIMFCKELLAHINENEYHVLIAKK